MLFNFKNHAKSAFTLAEILIVLAVIGSIAALTVPSLYSRVNPGEQANQLGIKKYITEIDNATKQILIFDAPNMNFEKLTCPSSANKNDCLRDYYGKYINFTKTCESSNYRECRGDAPMDIKLDDRTTLSFSGHSYGVTADGAFVSFIFNGYGRCNVSSYSRIEYKGEGTSVVNECAGILVDVNGPKGPNKVSEDIYEFSIGKWGLKTH